MTIRRQPGYDHSYFFIATFIGDHIDFRILRRGVEMDIRVVPASPPDEPARNDTWLPSLSPFRPKCPAVVDLQS